MIYKNICNFKINFPLTSNKVDPKWSILTTLATSVGLGNKLLKLCKHHCIVNV